jgi:ribonuclease E
MAYSKRQKEEAKPRQEAMVKTITPEQPAPLVDRKPTETVIKPAPPQRLRQPSKVSSPS